jgi:SAM-dependent methyltransferase
MATARSRSALCPPMDQEMDNPWLKVPAADYETHMDHESVRQGEMIREHLAECMKRFEPKSLLYLGACLGNGLDGAHACRLEDILAVDINPEYLRVLRERFKTLQALRTEQCSFPEDFKDPGCFELAYSALFFEYVHLESTLRSIAAHLTPGGRLVSLLQQPSEQGQMTRTGVTSLEVILPIMSLHAPEEFRAAADCVGMYRCLSTRHMESPCGKPFCEIVLEKS